MNDGLRILALITSVGGGLVAGFFLAFSSTVMGALSRQPPPQGIAAMNSINVVVINPWFMVPFLGTGVACLAVAIMSLSNWQVPSSVYLLAGSLLYLVGTVFVTMAFNVPRNGALASVDSSSAEGARLWADYVKTWTAWNTVRTLAALLASVLVAMALTRQVT